MNVNKLTRNKVLLFICDIQQNFLPKTYCPEGVLEAAILAVKVANIFKIPIVATQHYPKAFGKLVQPLTSILPQGHHLSQKITFSMIDDQISETLLKYPDRNQIVLVGMETHVCILQTFLDLKAKNYQIFLPADAITSIRSWQRTIALQRMQNQGGIITSVESMSFQMLGNYKDQHFKTISTLLKQTGNRSKAISHL